jgi:hypothetical protein
MLRCNKRAGRRGRNGFVQAFRQLKRPQMELGADLKHNSLGATALASQP